MAANSKPRYGCPSCGCRLYKDFGPCKGEDFERENVRLRDALAAMVDAFKGGYEGEIMGFEQAALDEARALLKAPNGR